MINNIFLSYCFCLKANLHCFTKAKAYLLYQPTTNNVQPIPTLLLSASPIIRIPAYPDLRFADKDAEAFANYLRSDAGGKLDGDHLKVLINSNATMAQFNALDWLWEVCKEGRSGNYLFSGHGDVEKRV